jgi:excisionase family DNA binding protein
MFLTTGQIEKLYKSEYGITRYLVTGWLESGVLTGIKTPGGHLRIRKSDVEKLLGIASEDSLA